MPDQARQCVFCGTPEGGEHTPRCSVTRHGVGEDWHFDNREQVAHDRDRFRDALNIIHGLTGTQSVLDDWDPLMNRVHDLAEKALRDG